MLDPESWPSPDDRSDVEESEFPRPRLMTTARKEMKKEKVTVSCDESCSFLAYIHQKIGLIDMMNMPADE